jgi:endonuclease/exonuclease/phosphatase (EEP) superfamily protein YafD
VQAVKVLTWNVLHRVHAETYSDPAIVPWPDETKRVEGVVRFISNALKNDGFDVVLLQEVSGDVLTALREALPEWDVFDHCYPRMPRQKQPSTLKDPREHLVVIAPSGSTLVRAHTFESDHGKGFVMVRLPGGFVVASVHLTWGGKALTQLAVISQVLADAQTPLVMGGDFNAGRRVVEEAAGPSVEISSLPDPNSFRTRPDADGTGGSDIDHLLARHATLKEARVLECNGLSDHRPVAATLGLPLPAQRGEGQG